MDSETAAEASSHIDIRRIMEMIPHRYPFLMIDRLIETVPEERAVAIKNVTFNEPHFQGHFPGHPIMPGVLIIEAMAQTAAALVVHTLGQEAEGKLVYFTAIENARFRRPIVPGDTVRISVQKVQRRRNLWRFSGEARVDGNLTSEATFAAMIMER